MLVSEFCDINFSVIFPTAYHVDNGFLLENPVQRHGVERLRVLASHGAVIKITRDGTVPRLQNKYTIEPSLAMDQSEVLVERPRW